MLVCLAQLANEVCVTTTVRQGNAVLQSERKVLSLAQREKREPPRDAPPSLLGLAAAAQESD
jgi:hypothetical protein